MKYDYVIIGASAAGIAAATKIRSLDTQGSVLCIDKQNERPYNTCLLVDVLVGEKSSADIALKQESFFEQAHIDVRLGVSVQQLLIESQQVVLSSGEIIGYAKLLLATGTEARSYFDFYHDGFFHFHQLKDVRKIERYLRNNSVRSIAIIGSGLSGIEAADAFIKKGYRVHIFEKKSYPLSEFLDEEAATFLLSRMETFGVRIECEASVLAIVKEMGGFVVRYNQKESIFDMVVEATGSMQNIALTEKAPIRCTETGIWVDHYLQTSVNSIYAAGDVIGIRPFGFDCSVRNGTWPEAVKQGMIAGQNMVLGTSITYEASVMVISSRFFNLAFMSGGMSFPMESCVRLVEKNELGYYSFYVDNGRLLRSIMIGQLRSVGYVRRALQGEESFSMETFLRA